MNAPPATATVIETRDERDLALIAQPEVQAVIFIPETLPTWLAEFAEVVRSGAFQVPRTILDDATFEDIEAWLALHMGGFGDVRDDVLSLVKRERELTGATRFIFRVFTAVPSRHCGFHVDTVPPAAPTHGLLRVYNGNGTHYVAPESIVSMREFYRYLSRRERLVREETWDAVAELDELRPFLRSPEDVRVAPAGSTVAFKHLDVRLHWSDHPRELAWVHCSPMDGEARFVVNVSGRRPAR